jgi:hypothetical protein
MSMLNLSPLSDSEISLRFAEPFMTGAVNRKSVGVTPHGIYRGWRLAADSAPLTVKILAGPEFDHVAVMETVEHFVISLRRSTGSGDGSFVVDLEAAGIPASSAETFVLFLIGLYAQGSRTQRRQRYPGTI